MKWAFDNSAKLIGVLSVALVVIATVHDWGYFLVIGPKFRSIQTTYDYITSAIEWLPTFMLGLTIALIASLPLSRLVGDSGRDFGFADQRLIYWVRRSRLIVPLVGIPFITIALFLGLLRSFPLSLIQFVGSVGTVVLGGALLAIPWMSNSIRSIVPYVIPASGLLSAVFIAGITDGVLATKFVTDVHRINLKGGEIRYASVLRTFEKGVLVLNPTNESVQFVRWEKIDELSHPERMDQEPTGCRLLGWFCTEHFEP